MEKKAEVVIVGGGSTGSSILYRLAKSGMTDAILVERGGQIASGQTSRSTAIVRTHYSHPTVAGMALRSYRFFQRFEEEVGIPCGFVETGLLVGADPKSEEGLRENVAMFREIGIVSGFIDGDEAKRIEPRLDPDRFSSIVHEPQAGYAEPSTTASAFARAAQEMGAGVELGTEVLGVERSGGGYSVRTSSGEVRARKVVLATGVWSPRFFQGLGIRLPIKPVRHAVAIYGRPEEYLGTRAVVFDFPRSAYYKPEGRHLLFVGSLELEADVTQAPVDPDGYDQNVSFDEITKFTEWVSQALPVMGSGGRFERGYTGVYDVTPDQQPIIDDFSDEGREGLFCLVGLSGHGFKLSPEFGRIMSGLLLDGRFRDYDVSIFRRSRFEEGRLLKSRYELSTIG